MEHYLVSSFIMKDERRVTDCVLQRLNDSPYLLKACKINKQEVPALALDHTSWTQAHSSVPSVNITL